MPRQGDLFGGPTRVLKACGSGWSHRAWLKIPAGLALRARRRPAQGDRGAGARASCAATAPRRCSASPAAARRWRWRATIELVQKPTLVLCHNKTLAAQLCAEFREFFPNNAVEYFVSYFDYYQPEAYIAITDTYIEKDSSINDEIERLRHSATQSLLTRPRHADRRVGLVHLRLGLAVGLHGDVGPRARRRRDGPRRAAAQARRHAVPAQRHQPRARHVPRARRHARVRRRRRGAGPSHRVFRRRDRSDQRRQHADRRIRREQGRADDLPGQALHHARRKAAPRDRVDRSRARRAARSTSRATANCWKRSGWKCARATISTCCAKSGTATASRTTRGI